MRCLILALTLGACAPAIDSGYVLPPSCRGNLDHVKVPVLRVAPAMLARTNKGLTRQVGAYFPPGAGMPDGLIWVDATLSASDTAKVLRHEKCHHLLGAWHP